MDWFHYGKAEKSAKRKWKIYYFNSMSGVGGSTQFGLRWQDIGLRTAGNTLRKIAKDPKCTFCDSFAEVQEVWNWRIFEDKPRTGGPSALDRVSKIVLAKSLTKKRQSTRALSRRLSNHGHQVSHMKVPRYLSKNLGAHAYTTGRKFQNWRKNMSKNDWNSVGTDSTETKKIGVRLFSVMRVLMNSIHLEILRMMSSGLLRKDMLSQ